MTHPIVSIIIPAYNADKYIEQCIESVLNLHTTDFELLIINDGSADTTGSICDKYAKRDSRVKVFHQLNHGVSSARNIGINTAIGEWLTFLDADDEVETRFADILKSEVAKNADWIFNEWTVIESGKTTKQQYDDNVGLTFKTKEDIKKFWCQAAHQDICRCPWGKFFRTSIIKQYNLQFDESLSYAEDTVFNYEYLTHVSSIVLNKEKDANYLFKKKTGEKAVIKYKCKPEGIVTARNKIFDIFFANDFKNLRFERLMLFNFTMMEHNYLSKKDDAFRKEFYYHPIQVKLQQRTLSTLRCYDRWMYLAFKHLPHKLLMPLAKIYLQYR